MRPSHDAVPNFGPAQGSHDGSHRLMRGSIALFRGAAKPTALHDLLICFAGFACAAAVGMLGFSPSWKNNTT
jgi:hypothetical protein